jgi:hypothetical protein
MKYPIWWNKIRIMKYAMVSIHITNWKCDLR